jgi:hypothetical protein
MILSVLYRWSLSSTLFQIDKPTVLTPKGLIFDGSQVVVKLFPVPFLTYCTKIKPSPGKQVLYSRGESLRKFVSSPACVTMDALFCVPATHKIK